MTTPAPWLFPLFVLVLGALVALFRLRARLVAVPLADARALGRAARRVVLLRGGLAILLIALLALAFALVRRPEGPIADLIPATRSTVVVLDASASVGDLVYQQVARTLQAIVDEAQGSRRVGLVIFSDVAQEALPPGTRAAELERFIRFYLPKDDITAATRPRFYRVAGPGAPPPPFYPLSPWFFRFSAGTRISAGLRAARAALERDSGGRGRVVLLSDLQESLPDLPDLSAELVTYARTPSIDLRVVALPPAIEADKDLFRRTLGERGSVLDSDSLATKTAGLAGTGFPLWFVLVAALVAVALAVNELVTVPLGWRRSTRGARG